MRPRLFLVLVSALVVALAGLSPSPASGSTQPVGGLADQWPEMSQEERAVAWSLASLQRPTGDPEIVAVAPDAGPFDSAGPAIIAMGRTFLPGQTDVSAWNGVIPGGTWYDPATDEFYAIGPGLVVNHLVFDDAIDRCGNGQVEVAQFEDIPGATRFPGLPGFTTPDTTSTRALAHLCRGGQNQLLFFTGDQPGQPFSAAFGGLLFTGPAPGLVGDRQQLITLTNDPDSVLLFTVTVAENPQEQTDYRFVQLAAPATQTVDLDVPPQVTPEQEVAILTARRRPVPTTGEATETAGQATDGVDATAEEDGADGEEAGQGQTGDEAQTLAAQGGDDDGTDELPEAQEIDNTTAIVDQPDDGGIGPLLAGFLVAAFLAVLIVLFLLRNVLLGWFRPTPPPTPTTKPGYTEEPVSPDPDPRLDNFFNHLVNQGLEAGRRPDDNRQLEFDEEELNQAYRDTALGAALLTGHGVFLDDNTRLVVNVDTFEAVVRTYQTPALSAD